MQNCTLDDLKYKGLNFYQPKNGYRSSEDSLILQNCILEKMKTDFSGNAFEFGTGCGLVSLLLALKVAEINITAIDIQKSLITLAKKNVKMCNLENKINLRHLDIKDVQQEMKRGHYDICFANPPFYKKSSGKLSPNRQKQIARHEILCSMNDILASFNYLLRKGKTAFIVYPLTRLAELKQNIFESKQYKIENLRFFKGIKQELKNEPQKSSTKYSFCIELKKL
ncbi:MAG: methyltransferase [Candidatus Cloacimonetes bacterium]|nr:methyltransferase [Candidatus Cloacimonadota bacterium]